MELPCLRVVHQERVENRVELRLQRTRLDRSDDLDAVIEVARQEIGAPEEVPALLAALEDEEAAVLQEAAEHAPDPHVLAHPLDSGTEPADAAGDDVDR